MTRLSLYEHLKHRGAGFKTMAARLVEGDVIKHVDGSLWVVKGCVHTSEGFVAVPRVVGSKKIKRFAEAMEVVKRYYFHYIRKVQETGREVPVVPENDILEVRRWGIEGRECGDPILRQFLQILDMRGLNCGIAGSHLGGYSRPESDIDVHCLDSPGAYSKISSLYSSEILRHLDLSEAVHEVVDVSESLDSRKHAELITKKNLQGMYGERKVTIRIVNCDRIQKLLGPYLDSRNAELVVKVAESDYRTPTTLRASVVRASILVDQYVYLISHRVRFTELPVETVLHVDGAVMRNSLGNLVVNLDEAEVKWISLG